MTHVLGADVADNDAEESRLHLRPDALAPPRHDGGEGEVVARQQLIEAASKDHGDSSASKPAEQVVARSVKEVAARLAEHEGRADAARTAEIARWCEEAAQQFVDAPIQTFVPILVHHIVNDRMATRHPRSEAWRS